MMRGSCRLTLTFVAVSLALLVSGCQEYGSNSVEQGGIEEVGSSRAAAVEACTPTGAHTKHAAFSCTTCHACGGGFGFDPNGAAVAAGQPSPAFDPVAKTCSNVACHGMPSGTFSYTFPGGDGEPELKTASYGNGAQVTPSWYSTSGVGCTGCHGNPPSNYTWHGFHSSGGNSCTLCHPHVVSQQVGTTSQYIGVSFQTANTCGPNRNQPCVHANGVVDVSAAFRSTCFNCH